MPLTHGQSSVSITWLGAWGRALRQAPESCTGNRNGLLSFRLLYHQSFKSSDQLSDKSQKNGLKSPKINLTLWKHFHLLDLYFISVFCFSSHSQVLKPENFPGMDFVHSHHLEWMWGGGGLCWAPGEGGLDPVSACQQELLSSILGLCFPQLGHQQGRTEAPAGPPQGHSSSQKGLLGVSKCILTVARQ